VLTIEGSRSSFRDGHPSGVTVFREDSGPDVASPERCRVTLP
jgi:hypothetical protein